MNITVKLVAGFFAVIFISAVLNAVSLFNDFEVTRKIDHLIQSNIKEVDNANKVNFLIQRTKSAIREILTERFVSEEPTPEIGRARLVIEQGLTNLKRASRQWENAIRSDMESLDDNDNSWKPKEQEQEQDNIIWKSEYEELQAVEHLHKLIEDYIRVCNIFLDRISSPHESSESLHNYFHSDIVPVSRELQPLVDSMLTEAVDEAEGEGAFFEESFRSHLRSAFVTNIAALLLGILFSIFIARKLTRSIIQLKTVVQDIEDGSDPEIIKTLHKPKDEIGDLITAFEKMLAQIEKTQSRLISLSKTDALTELANRRKFDEALGLEIARSKRFSENFALVMIDIDHFKEYNDYYGHPAGDHCLKEIAQVLTSCTRRSGDSASRYGGEEFVMILVGIEEDQALKQAEILRQSVELLSIEHARSEHGRVTISAGIAIFKPEEEIDAKKLISLADKALYIAKEGGRNRVEINHSQ